MEYSLENCERDEGESGPERERESVWNAEMVVYRELLSNKWFVFVQLQLCMMGFMQKSALDERGGVRGVGDAWKNVQSVRGSCVHDGTKERTLISY